MIKRRVSQIFSTYTTKLASNVPKTRLGLTQWCKISRISFQVSPFFQVDDPNQIVRSSHGASLFPEQQGIERLLSRNGGLFSGQRNHVFNFRVVRLYGSVHLMVLAFFCCARAFYHALILRKWRGLIQEGQKITFSPPLKFCVT